MAELVDALALGASAERHEGSIPFWRTNGVLPGRPVEEALPLRYTQRARKGFTCADGGPGRTRFGCPCGGLAPVSHGGRRRRDLAFYSVLALPPMVPFDRSHSVSFLQIRDGKADDPVWRRILAGTGICVRF